MNLHPHLAAIARKAGCTVVAIRRTGSIPVLVGFEKPPTVAQALKLLDEQQASKGETVLLEWHWVDGDDFEDSTGETA